MTKERGTRWLLGIIAATLFVQPIAAQPHALRSNAEDVWIWSSRCDGEHRLGVSIRHESRTLYQGVLPICRGAKDGVDGRVAFRFSGKYVFQGEYHTASTQVIEGNVWEAGGESNALILGVSFATKKQILLNTLHIAHPDKRMSTELDKGLMIDTYPVSSRWPPRPAALPSSR